MDINPHFDAAAQGFTTPGSHVRVMFGHREVDGVVVEQTITGRYRVELTVPGADDPVMTTFAPDELRLAS